VVHEENEAVALATDELWLEALDARVLAAFRLQTPAVHVLRQRELDLQRHLPVPAEDAAVEAAAHDGHRRFKQAS